jgi:hypothetical protein
MTHEKPSRASRRLLASNRLQGSSGAGLSWIRVDRELEARARVVVTLDAIEAGDVRLAEDVLFQLLDDLDAAETILARAA